ncbi:tRNA(fMet)-specific endonuclease VapC [Planctomycetales bacterium]|nr:tRNA(fMet)-specific endonuclease VapC [Planctomycetales bacterium]
MICFLDTNSCVFFMNGKNETIRQKVLAKPKSQILIPAIVAGELYYGAEKSGRREFNLRRAQEFLSDFAIAVYDEAAAIAYGKIKAELERRGEKIPVNDYLIAAIVWSRGGVLVTDDAHFSRIRGLIIENWN